MCRHELDARALEALKPAPQPRTYHGVPLLPTAPLLTAIDEAAAVIRAEDGGLSDRERAQLGLLSPAGTLCARADVTSRTYLAWRTGERPGVQASVAERVFFALDVLWWEVYDAERWPAEHEAARKVFG